MFEKNTYYAPAAYAPQETVARQAVLFGEDSPWRKVLDTVSEQVLVLNRERQIVYYNRTFDRLFGGPDDRCLLGLRVGEAMACANANHGPHGCGTAEACRYCGAVQAVLTALDGQPAEKECLIESRHPGDKIENYTLRVNTSPLELGDERYIVWTAADISHEKRRRALERIFFHDILNTLGGLKGFSGLLPASNLEEVRELTGIISELSERLILEINSHRELLAAENNELAVHLTPVRVAETLAWLKRLYEGHEAAKGKSVVVDGRLDPAQVATDRNLLQRVVGNMVINALEASLPGQTVTLGCRSEDGRAVFWVHNRTDIPRPVQLQIFRRAYSTKGEARGLGTYSMKLLAERYLGGRVCFTTSPEEGTTFRLSLPLDPPREPAQASPNR